MALRSLPMAGPGQCGGRRQGPGLGARIGSSWSPSRKRRPRDWLRPPHRRKTRARLPSYGAHGRHRRTAPVYDILGSLVHCRARRTRASGARRAAIGIVGLIREATMIRGVHTMFYSSEPEAFRRFRPGQAGLPGHRRRGRVADLRPARGRPGLPPGREGRARRSTLGDCGYLLLLR